MDSFVFFLSPIGVVMIIVLLSMLVIGFRVMSQGASEQRRAYQSLVEQAKKRSKRKIAVVTTLRRRADSLRSLVNQLAISGYSKLELIVIIHHTAGSKAEQALAILAEQYGVSIKTVRYTKGDTTESLALQHSSSDYLMYVQPHQHMTRGFFERVAYAFATGADAIAVRRYRVPGRTLHSAFQSLRVIFQQALRMARAISQSEATLSEGIVVKRAALRSNTPFVVQHVLFEQFALTTDSPSQQKAWRSIAEGILLIILMWTLIATTSSDVLLYISSLLFVVFIVVAALFVMQYSALSVWQRVQLVLLLPFYPFVEVIRIIFRAGATATHVIATVLHR